MYLGLGHHIHGWKCLSHIVGGDPSPLVQEEAYGRKALAARDSVIQASCNHYSMSLLWKIYEKHSLYTLRLSSFEMPHFKNDVAFNKFGLFTWSWRGEELQLRTPTILPIVDRGTPLRQVKDLQRYVWTTNTSRADLV